VAKCNFKNTFKMGNHCCKACKKKPQIEPQRPQPFVNPHSPSRTDPIRPSSKTVNKPLQPQSQSDPLIHSSQLSYKPMSKNQGNLLISIQNSILCYRNSDSSKTYQSIQSNLWSPFQCFKRKEYI